MSTAAATPPSLHPSHRSHPFSSIVVVCLAIVLPWLHHGHRLRLTALAVVERPVVLLLSLRQRRSALRWQGTSGDLQLILSRSAHGSVGEVFCFVVVVGTVCSECFGLSSSSAIVAHDHGSDTCTSPTCCPELHEPRTDTSMQDYGSFDYDSSGDSGAPWPQLRHLQWQCSNPNGDLEWGGDHDEQYSSNKATSDVTVTTTVNDDNNNNDGKNNDSGKNYNDDNDNDSPTQ
ncbi:hypothetical protein EDB83DRAFT_2319166 [Lactarius deliciosus]|nr:hypothetical protein EDB83DRAFT_2319166 [Lactarius deliciosus]